MSTNDVPGANPANGDELRVGCWAEHGDGSLIFVESTEGGRVVFSIFDCAKQPVTEYRHALPEINFKRQFSWQKDRKDSVKWTWHDKTPFPWDRVIKAGARDGVRFASADDLRTAAERVADSLQMRAREFDEDRVEHLQEQELQRTGAVLSKIESALRDLPNQIASAVSAGVSGLLPKKTKKK